MIKYSHRVRARMNSKAKKGKEKDRKGNEQQSMDG